ncbi:MAG: LiaF domain-containing protein [Chloroflexota bacterium]
MSEQSEKQKRDGQIEWSFDFANLGESLKNMANSLAGEEEIHETSYTVAKTGVETARVKINFAAGNNFINALDASNDNLLEAHLKHIGEVEFTEDGDAEKTVVIKQAGKLKNIATPFKQGLRLAANSKDVEWNVHLAPNIPLSLKVNGGVGPTKVDLTTLIVRDIDIDAGVGQFMVTLPQQDEDITLDIDSGVGETKIYVPENVNATLDIDAGVGNVDVTIPPNTAVQIKAKSGIGSIHVPNSLRKYDDGHWQSEGFDLAEKRITIHYDGGIGSFHVREAQIV